MSRIIARSLSTHRNVAVKAASTRTGPSTCKGCRYRQTKKCEVRRRALSSEPKCLGLSGLRLITTEKSAVSITVIPCVG